MKSGLILFALAEIIAQLLPPSLWAIKEEVASCTRKQTQTGLQGCCLATPPPPPHPYCMLTVLRQPVWTAAFRLCCPTSCFLLLCGTFWAVCLCLTSSIVLCLPEVLCAARKWVKNCGEASAICSQRLYFWPLSPGVSVCARACLCIWALILGIWEKAPLSFCLDGVFKHNTGTQLPWLHHPAIPMPYTFPSQPSVSSNQKPAGIPMGSSLFSWEIVHSLSLLLKMS